MGSCGAAPAERSGDPRRDDCSATLLLVGKRGRKGFGDSSSHGDRAFVPTGISPDPQRFSGWNLENEGLCSFLLAGAGRSSTLSPERLSTCSIRPAREIRSHRAPGAAGQSLLPSVAKLCPAVTPMRPHLMIPIVYEPR